MKQFWIAIRVTLLFTVIMGAAYPLLVTGLAKAIFPRQASGSLIEARSPSRRTADAIRPHFRRCQSRPCTVTTVFFPNQRGSSENNAGPKH